MYDLFHFKAINRSTLKFCRSSMFEDNLKWYTVYLLSICSIFKGQKRFIKPVRNSSAVQDLQSEIHY